jgi:hypothetical protein
MHKKPAKAFRIGSKSRWLFVSAESCCQRTTHLSVLPLSTFGTINDGYLFLVLKQNLYAIKFISILSEASSELFSALGHRMYNLCSPPSAEVQ